MTKVTNRVRSFYNSGDKYCGIILTGKSYMAENSQRSVECICFCGVVWWVKLSSLKQGTTKSCGCTKSESMKKRFTKHGLYKHELYGHWEAMKQRCYNKNYDQYNDYGGRGIIVCDEWVNDPKSFIEWALNNGWEKGLSLDRHPNNDGNYEPSNCRWATEGMQKRNKRTNHLITAFGETKCVTDWALDERCKVVYQQVLLRMQKYAWGAEAAISTPPMNRAVRNKGMLYMPQKTA